MQVFSTTDLWRAAWLQPDLSRTLAGICLPLDGADLGCSNVPALHGNTFAQRVGSQALLTSARRYCPLRLMGSPTPQPLDEGRSPTWLQRLPALTAGAACSPRIGEPPAWPKVPLDTQRRTCCTWPGPARRLCPKAFPESKQMQADRAHIPSELHSRLRNFCPKGSDLGPNTPVLQ